MNNKLILAVSAVIAIGTTHAYAASMEMPAPQNEERCYGIAKAGMNDCATESNNCGGSATVDHDPQSWLFLPTGLCKRIAGGSLTPPKKAG